MKIAAGIVFLMAVVSVIALCVLSTHTGLEVNPPVRVVGDATPIQIRISGAHGLRRLTARIQQNGASYTVFESREPARRFLFWRNKTKPRVRTITVGRNQAPALKEGPAKLTLEAQSNDFLGIVDSVANDVQIITAPPRIVADSYQHYIHQGGAELVVFTPSGYWTESGARAGKYGFRSFPVPRSQQQRFALFAYSWDLPPDVAPVVYARNPAGMEATARFWHKLFPKKFRSRDLVIDDVFLRKVVSQIDPAGSGDLLPRFLKINGELRRKNNQTLSDLRVKTADHFLWSGPFLQLANSQVESVFADKRSYIYKGKKVDEQVHLGFDLAVTKNVAVPASNDGKVIYAADLGIYGNCVVLDHGYGLQSIYGHLSRIAVKPDQMVKKGQTLGNSGSTGLAGGDHLHYSMQVDGVQVNPVEWWDEHWIRDRILSKIRPGT